MMRDGLKISEELIAAIPQRALRGNGVVQLLTDDYEFLLAAATIAVETARKRREKDAGAAADKLAADIMQYERGVIFDQALGRIGSPPEGENDFVHATWPGLTTIPPQDEAQQSYRHGPGNVEGNVMFVEFGKR